MVNYPAGVTRRQEGDTLLSILYYVEMFSYL